MVQIPVESPQQKGMLVSNTFVEYTLNVTNLGVATLYRFSADSSEEGTAVNITNNTGSLNLQTSYPLIERTDYPYFYYGVGLFILALLATLLPMLPTLARKIKKES